MSASATRTQPPFATQEPRLRILRKLMLACGLRRNAPSTPPIGWIGSIAVLAQLVLTVVLWNGLDQLASERQHAHITAETHTLAERFSEALTLRITAVEHMARRWEAAGGTPEALWRLDAAAYAKNIGGFQALQWVDELGRVTWVEPEQGNEAALRLDNRGDPVRQAMLDRARAATGPIVTGPLALIQGGRGVLITRALRVAERDNGYLVAVFRTDDLLTLLSEEVVTMHYGISVTLEGSELFARGDAPSANTQRLTQTQQFSHAGRWDVRIWPTEAALQRGPFSDIFLASGLAMTVLVGIAFGFWARNAEVARKLLEANQALEAERNFVTGMIDHTNALSLVLDMEGRIVRFNHACEALTGYRFDTVREQPFWQFLVPPHETERVRQAFLRLMREGRTGRFECDCIAHDGSLCQIAWSNSVIAGPGGKGHHLMCVGIDITERQRTAEALLAAKEAADRANCAKSEFLSSMSHELRTPMNAVLGFAQLIDMDPELPAEHRENVAQILKGGELLLNLINDVLNFARIESGHLDLDIAALDVESMLSTCLTLMQPIAQRQNLCIHYPPHAPVAAHADRQFLKQVLLNLLSNAIKYNRRGGLIHISVDATSDERCCISIADTGVGIPEHLLPHLFEPFNRLGAENGAIEGTGIGLVVSKRLAEAMQGTISVTSTHGRGSTFSLTVPLAPMHAGCFRAAPEPIIAR